MINSTMNNLNNYKKINLILESIYYLCVISVALFLRLFELANRAMHHDESLHAYYSWQLHEGFGLIHNPMLHGPFQMEITSLIFILLGDSDFTSRILYALFGTLLVSMPIVFRKTLGAWGSIWTSLFLCFSPSMLYFSRFARNDIIMAVFTFGLIIALWKFLEVQKEKYLLIISFLIALSFGTKENAFLITAIIIFYCLLKLFKQVISEPPNPIKLIEGRNIVDLLSAFISNLKREFKKGIRHNVIVPCFSVMILLISLTLPQWTAFSGVLQDTFLLEWSGVTLVSQQGLIGMPYGVGTKIAIILTIITFIVSILIGYKWNWKTWLKCSAIFYITWLLIYTTAFSNLTGGITSGIWQTLGYWIVQQETGRGSQPEYYYLIMVILYEYLPLFISIFATVYHFKNPTRFSSFMIFWCLTTFIIYTIASEKMPWLLVHISLPMIIFSGYFTGIISKNIIKYKFRTKLAILIIPIILLFSLSIRTAIITTFNNADIPKEMLVYTQTSPDLKKSISIINNIDHQKGNSETPIHIDSTGGYTWPWAWYLRNRSNVTYGIYSNTLISISDTILIVHSENYSLTEIIPSSTNVVTAQKIPHRWWFPEHTYRDLSLANLLTQHMSPQKIMSAFTYWFSRNNVGDIIGSEDFYIVYPKGFHSIDLISDKIRS